MCLVISILSVGNYYYKNQKMVSMREAKAERIILMGVLTDICVMYTSADASARNYEVIVVSDATGSIKDENQTHALKHMEEIHNASVITTEQLLNAKIMM